MIEEHIIDEAGEDSFPASDPPSWTTTHAGPPCPAPCAPRSTRDLREGLRRDVTYLADELGERNDGYSVAYASLRAAADYVARGLAPSGRVQRRPFTGRRAVENVEARARGLIADDVIVVGAHYDSIRGPGADGNASGVAILLALAQALVNIPLRRSVRLVAFANEERPHRHTPTMGSVVYAAELSAERAHVTAMLSLETLGFFSARPHHRDYSLPLRMSPWCGDYVAFVGNTASRALVSRAARSFEGAATLRARRLALPEWLPGVAASDHRSFWRHGHPAIMITDTAPLRYRHYHCVTDTADRLDYDAMAEVVKGVTNVITDLSWS